MQIELDRTDPNIEQGGEPSLEEMTEKAIKILSKNPAGFFLMVEGNEIKDKLSVNTTVKN